MKDNKFEDYNQKGSIKESLNIKKEENNSPFSDSFVFKKEENKITWTNEYCSDGKEVNSNLTKLNNGQEEKQPELDQEKLQSSVSSTTAKIGTAVTTTAAVVTTAVVAVVGIDLVTTELVDELPQICEISEVVTTSETISFVLNIGNDEDEAYAEEPGAECNLVVELTCEKYDDVQELPVRNFGTFEGEFTGLREETDYSINVYQPSFLYLERQYILEEPVTASTERSRRNSISLEIEVDPLGNDVYYTTIDFVNTLGINLYNYRLCIFENKPNESTSEYQRDGYAYLDDSDPFSRQKVEWYSNARGHEIYVALYATTDDAGYIATHNDPNGQSGGREDEMSLYLFSNLVNLSSIEKAQATIEDAVYIERVTSEGSAEETYNMFIGCSADDYASVYERTTISAIEVERANGDTLQMTFPNNSQYDLPLNEPFAVNFENVSYAPYKFTVKTISHRAEDVEEWNNNHPDPSSGPATVDTGAETILYTTVIHFGQIPTEQQQVEPSLRGASFVKIGTPENGMMLGMNIEVEDPGEHIDNTKYSIFLSYNKDRDGLIHVEYEYILSKIEFTDYYRVEGIEESDLSAMYDLSYELYAMSDYNTEYGAYQKVTLGTGTGDISSLTDTYIDGSLNLAWRPDASVADSYQLAVTVYCDNSTYTSFTVYIWDLDGQTLITDFSVDGAYSTQTISSIYKADMPGNYLVETRGYNGSNNETLYQEVIDFGNIELSV